MDFMSRKTKQASAIALATMMVFTIAGAETTGALAQDDIQGVNQEEAGTEPLLVPANTQELPVFVANEVVQPLPTYEPTEDFAADDAQPVAASLEELVASIPTEGELSKDMQCLAGAIYFESRGEPLVGQLAVGRVIVNRTTSGRFPTTYCGVVFQRSQFSFVRGGQMPPIKTSSKAWHNAVAIARIAHEDLWDSPAKGALFFHASHVQPRWRLTRVAQVDSHVFYR
jgi:hypothetical protein